MLGVYIPGMEMPKSCRDCELEQEGFWCGVLDGYQNTRCFTNERREDCPLVPVPAHGRLIDADAELGVNVTMMPGGKCRVDLIAPTIIPADPAEEGET